MQPYYDHNGITIYHGRCKDVTLTERPALVLTDPPYGAKERTDRSSKGRGKRLTTHQSIKRKLFLDSRDYEPVEGDNEPFDPAHILVLQVPSILWGANYYADKLPASRCWLVWDKREGGTPDDNADCEMAWTNIDMPARLYSHMWRGVCRRSETGRAPVHPTQKPAALMRWCLLRAKLAPGALVFDPYMGSGPVAQACKELGYRYIGVEVVEKYCVEAIRRLSQEVMELI
jgi:site-specific DNA-methyltransferase (adenine-specific)